MCSHSRGALRPSYASASPSSRTEGAGKAGWPHAPGAPAQKKFARAREPQVQAVITPAFPAQWFYGLYELSSVNHPVCHRRPRDAQGIIANLAPDLGAPGPHDFAVRKVAARQSAPPRPPHPRLTCRDDRDTPLRARRDADTIHLILLSGKQKYFYKGGWTGFSGRRLSGKSIVRSACLGSVSWQRVSAA